MLLMTVRITTPRRMNSRMLSHTSSVHPNGRPAPPALSLSKWRRPSPLQQGDRYLRSLFTAGALAVIRYAKLHGTEHRPWLAALLARRPTKVAAIALANKIARMAWR
jgi:hypothetical protein